MLPMTKPSSASNMEIMSLFRQLARDQAVVRMLNIYKGLPISYDTYVYAVGASEIQMPSSKNHIACLYHQGETFLQGDTLPVVIRSKVTRLNLAKDFAILTNFEIVKNDIGKRMQIRVEPDEPLVATIQFRGSAYEFLAPVADISANGASVYFDGDMFPSRLAQPGNELTMSISLPDSAARKLRKAMPLPKIEGRKIASSLQTHLHGGQDRQGIVTAKGKIIAARHETASKRYHLNTQLTFKDPHRMVLLQYISQRQTEIIHDLRILSEDLYHNK